LVPEAIVNEFEVVKIHKQYRNRSFQLLGESKGVLEAL
jgi:hypothetical protein